MRQPSEGAGNVLVLVWLVIKNTSNYTVKIRAFYYANFNEKIMHTDQVGSFGLRIQILIPDPV